VASIDGGRVGFDFVGLKVWNLEGGPVVDDCDDGACEGTFECLFFELIVVCPLDGGSVGFDIVGMNVGNLVFELDGLVVVGVIVGETVR